jgi:hypothetical protein
MKSHQLQFEVAMEAVLVKPFKGIIFYHDRTRTCNLQIRSLAPYPLGYMVSLGQWLKYTERMNSISNNVAIS